MAHTLTCDIVLPHGSPQMRLFSYIVAVDSGFAPNPFWGTLTLACCKPAIRRGAVPGDLVVGLSSKAHGHRVVYVAEVTEKLTYREFWNDKRFARKRPDMQSADTRDRRGDNIYEPTGPSAFRQLPSCHTEKDKAHDLGGRYVLVSRASDFTYFGREGPELPEGLSELIVGRGHRTRFPEALVHAVARWRGSLPRGVQGAPTRWRADDRSWRPRC